MNPIEKYRLTQDIYFSLQTSRNFEEMKEILNGYGITGPSSKIYQQEDIKQLLNVAEDAVLVQIADDLQLDTSVYSSNTKKGKATKPSYLQKVFISHANEDAQIVSGFIQVLQGIGIAPEAIFCSSLDGYGVPLGQDFIEKIKTELNDEVQVFFMLSDYFYKSPMCLIEMGAAWIQTKDHISVAIPPFSLGKIKGVFKHFQGIRLDNEKHYDLLKENLESRFNIEQKRPLVWAPMRDMYIKAIKEQLKTPPYGNNHS